MGGARSEGPALYRLQPALADAMRALGRAAAEAGLDPALIELLDLRVSQINGCAYCLQYHSNEMAKLGVPAAKQAQVAAWRESPIFDARERVALEYAEAVTELPDGGVPDALHAAAEAEFGQAGLAALMAALVAINGWNRIAIAYRFTPPPARSHA